MMFSQLWIKLHLLCEYENLLVTSLCFFSIPKGPLKKKRISALSHFIVRDIFCFELGSMWGAHTHNRSPLWSGFWAQVLTVASLAKISRHHDGFVSFFYFILSELDNIFLKIHLIHRYYYHRHWDIGLGLRLETSLDSVRAWFPLWAWLPRIIPSFYHSRISVRLVRSAR